MSEPLIPDAAYEAGEQERSLHAEILYRLKRSYGIDLPQRPTEETR